VKLDEIPGSSAPRVVISRVFEQPFWTGFNKHNTKPSTGDQMIFCQQPELTPAWSMIITYYKLY